MAEGHPGPPSPAGAEPTLMAAAAMVFVEDPASPILTQGDARHLVEVLRLRPGELVIASDGAGSWSPCRLALASPGRRLRGVGLAPVLAVDGQVITQARPAPAITVGFAPTK